MMPNSLYSKGDGDNQNQQRVDRRQSQRYISHRHHIKPDLVHIMADGRIIKTGGPELALEVEQNGYADILAEVA